jgi:hypothetical protein
MKLSPTEATGVKDINTDHVKSQVRGAGLPNLMTAADVFAAARSLAARAVTENEI